MVKVTEGFLLYAQFSQFILQQKAEATVEIFYKIWKGSSQRFSNDGTPEKTQLTSTDCALPGFLTQGESGYEQNCLTKLLPFSSLFSTKAKLSLSSPTIPMEMLEQPKKKASYLCAIF